MRLPFVIVALQRRCPRCGKTTITKTSRHRYVCNKCGEIFVGVRLGLLRLGFS